MEEITQTVGSGAGGTITLYLHPNATAAELTVRSIAGRQAAVHVGHDSLLEIAASCAAVALRQTSDEDDLIVFSGIATYGTTPDGRLSIMPLGMSVMVALTPEDGSAERTSAELTFEDVGALGQHCAAAAHNR